MSDKPKIYEIDDLLKGYTNYDKLKKLYHDLRKNILISGPMQTSKEERLIYLTDPNWRGGSYGWELYSVNSSLIALEYHGEWRGYAHENFREQPNITKESHVERIKLTIHNSNKNLESKIEEIISKYPSSSNS